MALHLAYLCPLLPMHCRLGHSYGNSISAAMGRRSVRMWVGIMLLQALLFGGQRLIGKLAMGHCTCALLGSGDGSCPSCGRSSADEFRSDSQAPGQARREFDCGFQIMLMVAGVSQRRRRSSISRSPSMPCDVRYLARRVGVQSDVFCLRRP